ncbi:MAG TPA: ribonuclease D [Candidatus Udaeobacter sp.]|jgi:ribonuclease D|nr:ribonuclease D [Candidatus Udaeobacter sp.]
MALPKSASHDVIASEHELADLIRQIQAADRVALDTEADSLHSYREKLCLIQISVPSAVILSNVEGSRGTASKVGLQDGKPGLATSGGCVAASPSPGITVQSVCDFIVDPLSHLGLEPLRHALESKEIVLHAADYDLRMLRRGLNFTASKIYDTVVAARLLGIREFSLGALVKRFFGVELHKHSQKANWALRPLPPRMLKYAMDDVHYLLPLAAILEEELERVHRRDWFRQSCERAIELAAAQRERMQDELWRIGGAGALDPQTGAVLRALWQWREAEAEMVDRPPFHILQNRELLNAAESFTSGQVPDYKHFSARRRQTFHEAAKIGLQSPQSEWPVMRRRSGSRPTPEMRRRADQLRERRDKAAVQLGLERSFIASRGALEAVAADPARATALLIPWQRDLIGIEK